MASLDPLTLLTRQTEVESVLRSCPKTSTDLMQVRETFQKLMKFFPVLGRSATKLDFPLEVVFQALLQLSVGDAVNFDKQHRQGDVPMHQAKVLNRESANIVIPKLKGYMSAEQLDDLVQCSITLRNILKVKVEDGNDLSMARKAVTLGDEYLSAIAMMAHDDADVMWALYTAQDEASIRAIAASDHGDEDGFASTRKALPGNFVAGIRREAAGFSSSSQPVNERTQALLTVLQWLGEVPAAELADHGPEILDSLRGPLGLHLAEKRSTLTRAACDVLSCMAARFPPEVFNTAEAKDVISGWCTVLLTQVHVTVAAIAQAADLTLRDVVIATRGATYICSSVTAALAKASRPELQRRCVGYLCVCVIMSVDHTAAKTASAAAVVGKLLASGTEQLRRVARAFSVVAEITCPGIKVPGWDERCEKAAATERPTIRKALDAGVDAFELAVLRYDSSCKMANGLKAPPGVATPARAESRPSGHLPSMGRRPEPCLDSTARDVADVPLRPRPVQQPLAAGTKPQTRGPQAPGHIQRLSPAALPAQAKQPQPRPNSGVPLSLASISRQHSEEPDDAKSPSELCASLKSRTRRRAP